MAFGSAASYAARSAMSLSSISLAYPRPGEVIDNAWRIERFLGEGGMGAVARAWDLVLHTPVAIKFMNPQFLSIAGAEERFINEGRASALIKSAHVVPAMKVGKTANGTPYLVMECLEGADLAELLARDGRPGLAIERALHFGIQALRALQAAHAVGIIHRDMKPSNCFVVSRDGEDDFIKVLDFGISKIQTPGRAALTQTNTALGTPLYMSPEQARSPRDVDARSDLYSVGVILYELLTGSTPFSSESGEYTEILFKLFTMVPPSVRSLRPDIPEGLAAVIDRALSREPNSRFDDARAMAEAFAPYLSPRSELVLSRIRSFRAPSTTAAPPPLDLPQSLAERTRAVPALYASPDDPTDTKAIANRPTAQAIAPSPRDAAPFVAPAPPIAALPSEGLAPPVRAHADAPATVELASTTEAPPAPLRPNARTKTSEVATSTTLTAIVPSPLDATARGLVAKKRLAAGAFGILAVTCFAAAALYIKLKPTIASPTDDYLAQPTEQPPKRQASTEVPTAIPITRGEPHNVQDASTSEAPATITPPGAPLSPPQSGASVPRSPPSVSPRSSPTQPARPPKNVLDTTIHE